MIAVILNSAKNLDAMRLAFLVIGILVFVHPVMITIIDLASSDLIIQILDGLSELEIERIDHTERAHWES
ncbi:hypothetical protein ACFZC3_15385 [Streptomyces sp. NPDC007903]|uniref:hypothetical protein n=1 Tax=Streptomyces sp. NPDC007903 TaxID=3364786 RepID=UPI0036F0767C